MEFKEFKNEWPPWFQINLIFLIPTNTIAGIVPARMIKDSQRDIFSFFFFFSYQNFLIRFLITRIDLLESNKGSSFTENHGTVDTKTYQQSCC